MPSTDATSSSSTEPRVVERSARKARNAPSVTSFVWDNLFLCLIAYRLLNALTLGTFFQPDEYYQALEPAWWLAFGDHSGAWITWEWRNHLRSALHPALFAVAYRTADTISNVLHATPSIRASILLNVPKVVQAVIAAFGDLYTVKLAVQVYGKDSYPTWCTLWLAVGSAWNWFVSTRSFSNCAETTFTIIALYNWPHHWALGADEVGFQMDDRALRARQNYPGDPGRLEGQQPEVDETTRLRRSIFCASLAVILRPTNAIIWIVLVPATFVRGIWHHGMHWEINAFVREGTLCGSLVLVFSALVDRLFYDTWTFPLWHFFKFNVLQSLAVFYGNNNWHYYLSQGYPLLLTVAILPAAAGLAVAISRRQVPASLPVQSRLILHRLALISLVLPAALSILSHKEVRFIYPILPALHVLAARPLARFLGFPEQTSKAQKSSHKRQPITSRSCVGTMVAVNIAIALYTSQVHNAGIVTVTDYLRSEFETKYLPQTPDTDPSTSPHNLTFAILMPCHSIPWRSHLQYPPTKSTPGISGWMLTCEPPLNLNTKSKESYLDEADIFYLDPTRWLQDNMAREIPQGPHPPGVFAPDLRRRNTLWKDPTPRLGVYLDEGEGGRCPGSTNQFAGASVDSGAAGVKVVDKKKPRECRRRAWPEYLVFFEQLEPTMRGVLRGSAYGECARLFNSHVHDDGRRVGDVVVWCLHPRGRGLGMAGVEEVRGEL